MPKPGSDTALSVLTKIDAQTETLAMRTRKVGTHLIYYTRKLSGLVQILDFVPKMWDDDGKSRSPSELKSLRFAEEEERGVYLAILNSSLFYWLLTARSDMRNLNKRDVGNLPFNYESAPKDVRRALAGLARALMDDFEANSQLLDMRYEKLGTLRIQCIYPKLSKGIIDEIDEVLATVYGFDAEELDFVVNYDLRFRLGATATA